MVVSQVHLLSLLFLCCTLCRETALLHDAAQRPSSPLNVALLLESLNVLSDEEMVQIERDGCVTGTFVFFVPCTMCHVGLLPVLQPPSSPLNVALLMKSLDVPSDEELSDEGVDN